MTFGLVKYDWFTGMQEEETGFIFKCSHVTFKCPVARQNFYCYYNI